MQTRRLVYLAYRKLRYANTVSELPTQDFKIAIERSILVVRKQDHIRNTNLRSMAGITDIGRTSVRLKWDWTGHMSRMDSGRWTGIEKYWHIHDSGRHRHCPHKRWQDTLDAFRNN